MTQKTAKPIPEGFHAVTPHIVLDSAAQAIDFYKKAFGAEEHSRFEMGGKIVHAEIRISDGMVMLSDEMPPMPGTVGTIKSPKSVGLATAALMLYVKDADMWFERAVKAGCTVRMPIQDMFWGDRYGQVIDPFGHTWAIATHIEDVSKEEMARRQQAMMAQMAQQSGPKS